MPGLYPIHELPVGSLIKLRSENDPKTWIILKQVRHMAHIWPINHPMELEIDLILLKKARLGSYGWSNDKIVWCVASPPMRLSIGDSNAR